MVDSHAHGNQTEFAALMGTSRERVNRWVNGRSVPNDDYAEKLAALDGLSPDLFTGETDREWLARSLTEIMSRLGEAEQLRVEALEVLKEVAVGVKRVEGEVAQVREELAGLRPRKRKPA
jgi:transcriptional regulator with XRE-family HTH domain